IEPSWRQHGGDTVFRRDTPAPSSDVKMLVNTCYESGTLLRIGESGGPGDIAASSIWPAESRLGHNIGDDGRKRPPFAQVGVKIGYGVVLVINAFQIGFVAKREAVQFRPIMLSNVFGD